MISKLRLITVISVAAIVLIAFAIVFLFYHPWCACSGGEENLKLVDYSVTAGDISPVLKLKFSRSLDMYTSVKLLDGFFKTVGVWTAHNTTPGSTIRMFNINPPNLIGLYHLVVLWKNTEILNTSLSFKSPELDVMNFSVVKDEKGDTVYLEFVNLTLSESGESPYYFNRIRWTLDGQGSSEKIPLDHFIVGKEKTIRLNLAQYVNKGSHVLVVHFDYFDFNTVTVVVNLSV